MLSTFNNLSMKFNHFNIHHFKIKVNPKIIKNISENIKLYV